MAAFWKGFAKALRHFRRSAHHALNLVLILVAAGQGILAFFLARRDSLEPPDFLVERLRAELGHSGLRLDWDRVTFDWQGHILVSHPRIGAFQSGENWITANHALARVDRVALLFGKVRWREIEVENVSVFAPARNEPLASGLSLHLSRTFGEINVDHAYGTVLGNNLSVTGPLGDPARWFEDEAPAVAAVPTTPPGPAPTRDARDKIRQGLASAAHLAELLAPYHDFSLRVTLVAPVAGPPRARLHLSRPGSLAVPLNLAAGPDGKPDGLHLTDAELSTGEIGWDNWRDRRAPDIHLKISQLEMDGLGSVSQIRLEAGSAVLPPGDEGWRAWLDGAKPRVSAGAVSALGQTIGPVALTTQSLAKWPSLSGRLWTRWEGRPISVSGLVNPVAGSADATIEADVSFADLLERLPPAVKNELERRIGWDGRTHLSPRVVLEPGWKFARAELRATLAPFHLKPSTRWDELTLEAAATPEGIEVTKASTFCREGGYAAQATYRQRWDDTSFLLEVEGRVRPRDLDPVLTEDWWKNLWQDLTDFPKLPFASVAVGGQWNHSGGICARVAATLPAGGRYRGIRADEGFVAVAHAPHHTELVDLKVERSGGEWLRGSIAWDDPRRLPEPVEEPVTMSVRLDLRANLAEVSPLFGQDFTKTISDLRLTRPPTLSIRGQSQDHATPPTFDWNIRALTDGPSGWKQFDFEELSLALHIGPGQLALTDIKGRFLDGNIAGTVAYRNAEDRLDLDLDLTNGSWPKLVDWAKNNQGSLGTVPAEAPQEPSVPAAAGAAGTSEDRGRVWLKLAGTTPASSPDQFAGSGVIRVEEASLHTVRLFGSLSKLMETIGTGFSSFEFSRLESAFKLERGMVTFPSLKVEGPRARLQASGQARLKDRALDIDAELDLGKAPEEKSLLGKILSLPLDTLTKILPIKLFGTLDAPSWRFKADPRSLIFGQPGLRKETPAPKPAPEDK